MAYIKIGSYELPPPKRGVHITVSTAVDSARNSNGVVVGQRIGRDLYKIDGLEWPWLSASQWSRILREMSSFKFYVTFQDPVSNRAKTVRMYCGDRNGEPYYVNGSGEPKFYRNCRVNLIDTGE